MKAVRIHAFGGPEVLQLEDIARPVPAADELLIEVRASGVNPVDWVVREGGNDALRAYLALPLTLGWDAAGVVVAVGSAVTGFQPGDAVYGVPNFPGNGSYAEYCAAKASQFAPKPQHLSFVEAAAVPLAGLTAWTALFAHGKLQPGQRVLIQGASGGVGSFAVQFAKAKGAYVIGTASSGNLDYLRQLGADEALDYQSQQATETLREVDVVVEASPLRNNTARLQAVTALKTGGILVSVNVDFPFDAAVLAALAEKQATGELAPNQPRQDWLQEMTQLVEAGQVQVVVSKVYPLAQVAEAHRESQTWHVRGKLVLELGQEKE
ncbi:NADP-dependent oxidoreductase [Hymenobacter ginsengisoli]|uniref:NADP-dependent oxidoreductase n=1 Tax=Hymenobacter ginsengisoli TaxID=1051626 RepID=A0ABP8Q369_9BACT|nr:MULTISPECIES: NADP-dependent oxidoreductase [unclassified Hymenobacter]MBO2031684.1 NADP-dependent oxidoreductase [Hymenobacter sp. BT559]